MKWYSFIIYYGFIRICGSKVIAATRDNAKLYKKGGRTQLLDCWCRNFSLSMILWRNYGCPGQIFFSLYFYFLFITSKNLIILTVNQRLLS